MDKVYSNITQNLLNEKKRILVGYLLAGYKEENEFFNIMELCDKGGIDIFEIGFPSSNPYADGEVIATAHRMVNTEQATSTEYWQKIRNSTKKAIWLMAYYDDFILTKKYMEFAKLHLIDGIVIPDTDLQERIRLQNELKEFNIDVIGFANPSLSKAQLDEVFENFSLVYEQLYVGQTGVVQTKEMYHEMLEYTLEKKLSCAFAGFGINNYDKVKKILDEGFVGAIIGTEIIKKINISTSELEKFLQEIAKAV